MEMTRMYMLVQQARNAAPPAAGHAAPPTCLPHTVSRPPAHDPTEGTDTGGRYFKKCNFLAEDISKKFKFLFLNLFLKNIHSSFCNAISMKKILYKHVIRFQ